MAKYNVNTDLVNGDDLFLYIYEPSIAITATTQLTSGNTNVIAFATSCALQVDGETIDTSNKMSCRWNATKAGRNGYSVSADALYTDKSGLYSFDSLLADMAVYAFPSAENVFAPLFGLTSFLLPTHPSRSSLIKMFPVKLFLVILHKQWYLM